MSYYVAFCYIIPFHISPNRNCWGPLLRRKGTRLAAWVARGSGWGPAEFGWLARGFGAGGLRSSLELGARGVWIRSWEPAEFGWLARGSGAGGSRFWLAGTWRGPAEFGWNLDGWHAANDALGFSAQNWRFEPTYTVDKHFEQAQTYTNTHTDIHVCSEPNRFCKMRRKMNMMFHSNCSGCCGGRWS